MQLNSPTLCVPRNHGGRERSKVETLHFDSIRQGSPLSPMLYILTLEPFLHRLKANPVPRGSKLPGSTEVARYTANANDVRILLTSSAEVIEVSKEIGRYEVVARTKINREKSVGLQFGSVGRMG